MCHHQHSGAKLIDLVQQQHDLQAFRRVKVARRLVRNDQAGGIHQCPGYGHTLLLAAGQFTGQPVFTFRESHQVQYVRNAFADLPVWCSDHAHGEGHVVIDGHILDEPEILEDHAKRTAEFGEVAAFDLSQVKIIDPDLAAACFDLSGEKLDDRGFSRTGRSDKKKEFAVFDRKVQIPQHIFFCAGIAHSDFG